MNAFRHFAAPAVALCLGVGVAGCSSEPKAEQVPAGAQLLVQGDQMLTYTATRDGEVYVYDASDRTLLYSGQIEKGQTISIDPDEDKVLVDNKLVLEKDIHAGNRHRIYFQADRAGDERVVEKRTEIRERTAAEREPADTTIRREESKTIRTEPADTTIRREESKTVKTDPDGDVTVKKETTIKTD
jgi:hypothetical protein